MTTIARLGLIGLSITALAACSVIETEKVDYKTATKAPTLEVPPDLTQLSQNSRYSVAGGTATASGFQSSQVVAPKESTALNSVGDVRIERVGNQRWLVVKRPVDQLWTPIKDFWRDNGFALSTDQQELGIMETDWAENRAKLPQDAIRNLLGKVLESFYSTGERDRFRTRLERTSDGSTEIYISHRGLAEVFIGNTREQTIWQPRPTDPELENEFLRRLMVKLGGASTAQAQAQLQGAAAPALAERARLVSGSNNTPTGAQLDDGFDRAWRRVGLSLDRTGFTVEDRDRSKGLYFVRYAPQGSNKEPGFFSKLFSSTEAGGQPVKYQILLQGEGDKTNVVVRNAAGVPDTSANAQKILQVLVDDLK